MEITLDIIKKLSKFHDYVDINVFEEIFGELKDMFWRAYCQDSDYRIIHFIYWCDDFGKVEGKLPSEMMLNYINENY